MCCLLIINSPTRRPDSQRCAESQPRRPAPFVPFKAWAKPLLLCSPWPRFEARQSGGPLPGRFQPPPPISTTSSLNPACSYQISFCFSRSVGPCPPSARARRRSLLGLLPSLNIQDARPLLPPPPFRSVGWIPGRL